MKYLLGIGIGMGMAMACVQPASAQSVFGISEGTSIGSVTVVRSYSNNNYSITVPVPNPEFESYMVTAPSTTGICRITGLGISYANESQVRAAFGRLRTALDGKYGTSRQYDYNNAKSGNWAKDIRADKASLSAFWPSGDLNKAPALSSNIQSIGLEVRALDDGSLYLAVRYEFRNYARCAGDGADNRGL
ncbi:hypothetical protein [uncultured Sphingomonas sp.]|uniref:hypothetical protein n=1 Tax=uncultured Sphingomonas sp. TaxID=158754 RepID=UPI0035CBB32C